MEGRAGGFPSLFFFFFPQFLWELSPFRLRNVVLSKYSCWSPGCAPVWLLPNPLVSCGTIMPTWICDFGLVFILSQDVPSICQCLQTFLRFVITCQFPENIPDFFIRVIKESV